MRKYYPLLLVIAAAVSLPILYWIPSYGALMLMSVVAVLVFSVVVSLLILFFASVEKGAIATSRLLRKGWHAAHSAMLHH